AAGRSEPSARSSVVRRDRDVPALAGELPGEVLADLAVGGVDVDDGGLPAGGQLGVVDLGVADDDHPVAGVDQVGGGAVEADVAAAPLALDDVGLEAGAVVDVDHRHL